MATMRTNEANRDITPPSFVPSAVSQPISALIGVFSTRTLLKILSNII